MEWQWALLLIFGSLVIMMASGLPVAFCFMLVNLIGVYFFWGGLVGLKLLISSIAASVTIFALLPLPLFILMGEVLFNSGLAPLMMDTLDKWLGRLPGRLSLLAVAGGTLLSTLTGASMGSVAMLGSILVPEMEQRGYKKAMSLGPILGSGGLAIMIPPSGLAVLLGAMGQISIGEILIAIIVPGVLMAVLYVIYVITRCWLQPSLAPSYEVSLTPLREKLLASAKYILPVGFIIFMVVGVIFLGVATPTEAAATGAISTFILCAFFRRLNWEMVKKSISGTLQITIMMFLIITGAKAFSQILAFSGASAGVIKLVVGLPLAPIFIILLTQVVVLFLGMFMDPLSIMMISIPLFVPVVLSLGFDLVWFAVIILINLEIAGISPPFGLSLFVMKGVAPPGTTMGDIYRGALPFIGLSALAIGLIMAFPTIALLLPFMMR